MFFVAHGCGLFFFTALRESNLRVVEESYLKSCLLGEGNGKKMVVKRQKAKV